MDRMDAMDGMEKSASAEAGEPRGAVVLDPLAVVLTAHRQGELKPADLAGEMGISYDRAWRLLRGQNVKVEVAREAYEALKRLRQRRLVAAPTPEVVDGVPV